MSLTPTIVKAGSSWLKNINKNERHTPKIQSKLEKIVCEYEQSFESPKNSNRRKSFFVRKIVSTIEEERKCPPGISLDKSKFKSEPNIYKMRPGNEIMSQNKGNRRCDASTIDLSEFRRTKSDLPSTSNVSDKVRKLPRKFMTKLIRFFSKPSKNVSISSTYDNRELTLNYPTTFNDLLPQCTQDSTILEKTLSIASSENSEDDDIISGSDLPQSDRMLKLDNNLDDEQSKIPEQQLHAQTLSKGNVEIVAIKPEMSRKSLQARRSIFYTFSDDPPTAPKSQPKLNDTQDVMSQQKISNPIWTQPNKFSITSENSAYEISSTKIDNSKKDGHNTVALRRRYRPSLAKQSRLSAPNFATLRNREFRIPRPTWKESGNQYQK